MTERHKERRTPVDREVEEFIAEVNIPAAKIAARRAHAQHKRDVELLKGKTEAEALNDFKKYGLTGEQLTHAMRLWRACRYRS